MSALTNDELIATLRNCAPTWERRGEGVAAEMANIAAERIATLRATLAERDATIAAMAAEVDAEHDKFLTEQGLATIYRADVERLRAEAAQYRKVMEAAKLDAETIQVLLDLLNPLHGSLDRQTYDEKYQQGFDAPDDAEYDDLTVTGRQERDLTQAVIILENRLREALTTMPEKAG